MSKNAAEENYNRYVPYGDQGAGYYSDNTLGCFCVINNSEKCVMNAIKNLLEDCNNNGFKSASFNIGDLGAADGGTSMPLWINVIESIRKKTNIPICIYYEDQPINDFTSLFKRVHGLIKTDEKFFNNQTTNIHSLPEVYTFASGTSFHKQCFPSETMHFEFSATAMHWLRDPPPSFETVIHSALLPRNRITTQDQKIDLEPTIRDQIKREQLQSQSINEFKAILKLRSKELIKGGYCIILLLAEDPHGKFLGNTNAFPNSVLHTMNEIWKQMSNEGLITVKEFIDTNFCNYYKRKTDVLEIFKDDEFLNETGLELISCEYIYTPCVYNEIYKRNKERLSPAEYAKWYVPNLRTWSNITFRNGLNSSRSDAQKDALVDELFNRYQQKVESDPLNHGTDYVHLMVQIKKRH